MPESPLGPVFAFGAHSAVDGLALEADLSSVSNLMEDVVSYHRGHIK